MRLLKSLAEKVRCVLILTRNVQCVSPRCVWAEGPKKLLLRSMSNNGHSANVFRALPGDQCLRRSLKVTFFCNLRAVKKLLKEIQLLIGSPNSTHVELTAECAMGQATQCQSIEHRNIDEKVRVGFL